MKLKLHHVNFATKNVAALDQFYRDVLDMKPMPAMNRNRVTDQDYPGWEATVDGIPTPILRANYAFRAVRVPAGISVVEFRYRPRSVWLGAAITLGSLAAVATYSAVALGRRRRGAAG